MRRVVTAVAASVFAATGCGCAGDGGTSGKRVEIADLSSGHFLEGTCPPAGRITVDFQPGEEITIRNENRLLASLSRKEAFIGCRETRMTSPGGKSWEFPAPRVGVKQSTRLVCATHKPLVIDVAPVYDYDQQLVGGTIYVSTPKRGPTPLTMVGALFYESGDVTRLTYHLPRCGPKDE